MCVLNPRFLLFLVYGACPNIIRTKRLALMVVSGIKYNSLPLGVKGCGWFAIFGATRCIPNFLRWGAIVKVSPGINGQGGSR